MSVDLPHNRNELKVNPWTSIITEYIVSRAERAQRRREGAVQGLTYDLFLYSMELFFFINVTI